jgi:anti-sigma factor (TIGR02949 family)
MTAFGKLGDWLMKAMPPPGGIDCEGVMQQLYEYIDGELDEETVEKIRKHLKLCKECYPHYDFERAFLSFLSDHGRTGAPPELRRKIFASLLQEESEG